MGLFRKGAAAQEAPASAPAASSIPDYGMNQNHAFAPRSAGDIEKTTCYPSQMGGFAKFTSHARTTSYQQATYYNRRTYDTIN